MTSSKDEGGPREEAAPKTQDTAQDTNNGREGKTVVELDPKTARSFCRTLARELIAAYLQWESFREWQRKNGENPLDHVGTFLREEGEP